MNQYTYQQEFIVSEVQLKEKIKDVLQRLLKTKTIDEACELLEISEDYAKFILS